MCTVLLPPGVNPIAVDKYIISYIMRRPWPTGGCCAKDKQCNCDLSQESHHHHNHHHNHHHHHHHHHHHQATVQLCHLLRRSGLSHPEGSSIVFTGSRCLFVLSCLSRSEAFLRHVSKQFLLLPRISSQIGLLFNSFPISVCGPG